MSFHECGGNVGDDIHIPIPQWVQEIGYENPDIYFTDKEGRRNHECLSWGIDAEMVLNGRTPLEVIHLQLHDSWCSILKFHEGEGTKSLV